MLSGICVILICFIAAVKFGRMSKKQREKVEDEVRYHKAQMRVQTEISTPDSSVFDQSQTPSSSDQFPPYPSAGYVSI